MSTLTLAICARNAQDIIGDCLESIHGQTVKPDEVVVAVDDLSDPTAETAKRFGAKIIVSNATIIFAQSFLAEGVRSGCRGDGARVTRE